MDRNQTKKFLLILQAFAEGEIIECRTKSKTLSKGRQDKNEWTEITDIQYCDDMEYRIKPKPKYRPFCNTEECWGEMLKHSDFGWMRKKDDGDYVKIKGIDVGHVIKDMAGNVDWVKWVTLFTEYEFVDGAVMGVKIDE